MDPQWLQMGPEFSSDISADGPQQDGVSENLPIGSVPPSSGQRIVPVNPRVLDEALRDGESENLPLGSAPLSSELGSDPVNHRVLHGPRQDGESERLPIRSVLLLLSNEPIMSWSL